MAFAFVQTAGNAMLTNSTTNVVTPTVPLTAGNLVVLNIRLPIGTTVTSVTDNASVPNTYLVAAGPLSYTGIAYQIYGVQITGGATTVTTTISSSTTSRVVLDEFSGGASTNATVFDKSSTGTSGGASQLSASVTSFSPIAAGELISAGIFLTTAVTAITAGTGYVIANNVQTTIGTEYRLSSTTTETAPISWTTSSIWGEIAGAYKVASSPSIPPSTSIPYIPPFLS